MRKSGVFDLTALAGPCSQAAAERHRRNEHGRLQDEDLGRSGLLAAKVATEREGMTDKEFFSRMRGINHATWYAWMVPRQDDVRVKRIPGWAFITIHSVSPAASAAYQAAVLRPLAATGT